MDNDDGSQPQDERGSIPRSLVCPLKGWILPWKPTSILFQDQKHLQVLQLFIVEIKAAPSYTSTSEGQQCLPNVLEVQCTSL